MIAPAPRQIAREKRIVEQAWAGIQAGVLRRQPGRALDTPRGVPAVDGL